MRKRIMIIRICRKEASERLNINNTVQAERSAVTDSQHLGCVSERRDLAYVPIADNHKRIFRHGFNTASAGAISTKVTTACMKALPILVLLATSAVNPAPVGAQQCSQLATSQPRESIDRELINPVSNDTYTVVPSTQSPQTPQKKTSKENFVVHRTVENKTLVIVGYSTDSNKASAEKMYLHYKNYDKNPNYEVKAKIFGYCPEPREDGRLVAVFGLVGDNRLRLVAFPPEFKYVFDRSVMSEIRNNNAVKVFTRDYMIGISGKESIENAPGIEEFVPPSEP